MRNAIFVAVPTSLVVSSTVADFVIGSSATVVAVSLTVGSCESSLPSLSVIEITLPQGS